MNQEPKQAYITSSGAFEGIGFRRNNHEMFKRGQYQPENTKMFFCSLKQKINSMLTESTQSYK
jgi:hypothetical protein